MRAALLGAAFALAATAATAAEMSAASGPGEGSKARAVYVCDASQVTKRAFAREFGQARFVKASDVLQPGAAWSAPRCISASELRRLRQMQALAHR